MKYPQPRQARPSVQFVRLPYRREPEPTHPDPVTVGSVWPARPHGSSAAKAAMVRYTPLVTRVNVSEVSLSGVSVFHAPDTVAADGVRTRRPGGALMGHPGPMNVVVDLC